LIVLQACLAAFTAGSSSSSNTFAGSTASFLTTHTGASSSIRRDRKETLNYLLRMSPPHDDDTAEADAKAYNAIASSSVDITDSYIRNGILTGEELGDFCLNTSIYMYACCLHYIGVSLCILMSVSYYYFF
jgi:hypothetical protein